MFLEISQNSQENTFIKKETPAQLFPCEFCKISKNTFFDRPPLMAASALLSVAHDIHSSVSDLNKD